MYESKKPILKDVSVEFLEGKFYLIVGASGCGKTTFLSLILGLDEVKAREIIYQNQSLKKRGLSSYRNKGVFIIFQGYNLLNDMTAVQNVVAAMEIKKVALAMLERV